MKSWHRIIPVFGLVIAGLSILAFHYFSTSPLQTLLDAVSRCTKETDRTAFIRCIRRYIEPGIRENGMASYMEALGAIDVTVDGINRCHDIAHVIGQVGAMQSNAQVSRCSTSLCGDGCYHGFLESFVAAGGSIEQAAATFCQSIDEKDVRSTWACYHGVGHGIASLSGDVGKSLALCDSIAGDEGKTNCGAGVLMELYQSPSVDHTPLPLPEDIEAFCRSLASAYQTTCFTNTGIYTYQRDGDSAKAGHACQNVPPDFQQPCRMALGGVIFNRLAGNVDDVVQSCRAAGDTSDCLLGAVQEAVLSGFFEQAKSLCEGSEACYRYLGEKVAYGYGKARREEVCRTLPREFQSPCKGEE